LGCDWVWGGGRGQKKSSKILKKKRTKTTIPLDKKTAIWYMYRYKSIHGRREI
jgi:hypothetical protein